MTALREGQRVCVIGAGSCGIPACQVLNARGIPFDCFEQGSEIGGNWRFMNDNGMSSAYRSLHINTSKGLMSYATYPMPEDYPDYPDHFQIVRYFDDYVDHFGLRDRIQFRTEVVSVEPADDGEWDVTVVRRDSNRGTGAREFGDTQRGARETHRYGAVLVVNGHHWDPRWPEPAFPGQEDFTGEQLHVHDYKEADVLPGKRVLVLGIGNSACDIAVESSRIADATFLAMRRSAYIVPKWIGGQPIDETGNPAIFTRLPLRLQRFLFMRAIKAGYGEPTDYGLAEPDHKLLEAHPTVSSDLLPRIGHGDITVKPNIDRFEGGDVFFVDGSSEEIDLVIYCTGYKITHPFLAPELTAAEDNRIPLYRRVVSVQHPGLYFIGLVQPLGALMPIAELQSEWVADLFEGRAALPAPGVMQKVIEREDARMAKRYLASQRHTIQVDFYPYKRTIRRERRRKARGGPLGGLLARRSHELRVETSGTR